uniref:Uncharacterized protein n=1 Tax=Kalanchoe fedtschenkoi TaxID=63787 RepID=A0A7N0VL72_KALFE
MGSVGCFQFQATHSGLALSSDELGDLPGTDNEGHKPFCLQLKGDKQLEPTSENWGRRKERSGSKRGGRSNRSRRRGGGRRRGRGRGGYGGGGGGYVEA